MELRKVLINKNGEVVARFAPNLTADDEQIVKAVEAELANNILKCAKGRFIRSFMLSSKCCSFAKYNLSSYFMPIVSICFI